MSIMDPLSPADAGPPEVISVWAHFSNTVEDSERSPATLARQPLLAHSHDTAFRRKH